MMFLDACERGKKTVFISKDYVAMPRAVWEDIQRGTAKHRIVSIDEATIINKEVNNGQQSSKIRE
jgi:hypothetical protein